MDAGIFPVSGIAAGEAGGRRSRRLPAGVRWAVACYAAAQLAALDDASLQAALYNEFENRLSRLGELPVANREEIGNMYGGWEAVE